MVVFGTIVFCIFILCSCINNPVLIIIVMIDFNALFKVSYGLYIVSSGEKENGNGFISNSVFQVTAEPIQFAACCNKDNFTAEFIVKYKSFAISVLKQEASSELIGLFGYKSGRDINKLKECNVDIGETGVPIITNDAISYMECKLVQTFDVGTHFIFIGEVINSVVISNEEPLTYAHYRNVKNGIAPKNAPTYIDKSKLENNMKEEISEVYKCPICGYEHDIEKGDMKSAISAGTKWEDIPDTYKCPLCGAAKEDFYKL